MRELLEKLELQEAERHLNWGFVHGTDTKLTVDNPPVTKGAIKGHIHRKSGSSKTVCATTAVSAFGIDPITFNNCGTVRDVSRLLRREGISVKDAQSKLGLKLMKKLKNGQPTARYKMPRIKKAIKKFANSKDGHKAYYLVRTAQKNAVDDGHVVIVDSYAEPQTRVDTDPQVDDQRYVTHVKMLMPGPRLKKELELEQKMKAAQVDAQDWYARNVERAY